MIRQVVDWFIEILEQAFLGFLSTIDRLIPPAPSIEHTPLFVRPFLDLITRFIALDWLFYYGLILVSIYATIWGWRLLRHLWELIPFN